MDFPYKLDTITLEQLDIESIQSELTKSIDEYLELIRNTPIRLVNLPIIGTWSFKDVLAHFSAWNILTIDNIKRRFAGEDSIWIEDEEIDNYNQIEVNKRANLNWEQVCEEFRQTTTELLGIYKNIPYERWNFGMRLDSPGEFPMFMNILIDIKHFKFDHYLELKTALEQQKEG